MYATQSIRSTQDNSSMYYRLQAIPCVKPVLTPAHLARAQLMIVCEREDIELGQVLSGKLKGSALKVSAVSYKTLRIQPLFLRESQPQMVLVVLPRLLTVGAEETEIRQAVTRLYTLLNSLQHYQPERLLVAQFSDGQFGLDPSSTQHLEQVGWRSVLAQWSTQYPHSKATLIDCDSTTALGTWGDLVLSTLQAPQSFQTLAKRHDAYYQLSPLHHELPKAPQALPLRPSSVLMVLGVQSPLVTIYAATLAQQTGVSLALVGRDALANNVTMQRVLHHCQQAGVKVQYYACDVTREAAVLATVQQIQQDYAAPIEGVIYGALSANESSPNPTQTTDQVLSVVYLTQHLPQLVWWLSIVPASALLGTKQDYWSGYTFELINTYLLNQQKMQADLRVQLVGMEDIPINKGVAALLPLAYGQSVNTLFIGEYKQAPVWGAVVDNNQPEPEPEPEVRLEARSEQQIQVDSSLDTTVSTAQMEFNGEPSEQQPVTEELKGVEQPNVIVDQMEGSKDTVSEVVSLVQEGSVLIHSAPLVVADSVVSSLPEALVGSVSTPPEPVFDAPSPRVAVASVAQETQVQTSTQTEPRVLEPATTAPNPDQPPSEPVPIWLERNFTHQELPTTDYLTIHEFGRWQAELSLETLRPIVAGILNAELRILTNHVDCLDLLMDGHQQTTTRVYINDFTTNRLVLRYEHWGKQTSGAYYQAAQGNVILGYGVRCLERWLELPFPVEMVEKIRGFLNS